MSGGVIGMHGNDDEPTPNGADHLTVRGGELGDRMRKLEAEDVLLNAAVLEIRLHVDKRADALDKKLDQVIATQSETLWLRAFACIEAVAKEMFRGAAGPVYAAAAVVLSVAVLVLVLAATGLPFTSEYMTIGERQAAAANEDSDEGGSAASVAPDPAP